ncbi:MAG: ABC transporter ATP-binding protein [Desulfobacterales bacterium]|nr:ABC transporter ATP-binding protein [Desulfobacterales bacterium]
MKSEDKTLLDVDKLEVVYHNISVALEGVSFEVRNRQIVALLGVNGAGKTTTLRAISGFLGIDAARVTEGSIRFKGEEIQNKAPHRITKKGIVLVPEREKIFETLTVEENLQMAVSISQHREEIEAVYDLIYRYFPVLEHIKKRLGGYLSGGERQMLSLSTALLCRPQLLLVDELSLGLAPIIVEELMNLVRRIRDEQDVTVLLVEQNALAAIEIADFAYVLENGRIVLSGEPSVLKRNKDIQESYLGQGERDVQRSYRDIKQYRRTKRLYG